MRSMKDSMAGGRVDQFGILTFRVKPKKKMPDDKDEDKKEHVMHDSKADIKVEVVENKVEKIKCKEVTEVIKEVKVNEEVKNSLNMSRNEVGFLCSLRLKLVRANKKDCGVKIKFCGNKVDKLRPVVIKGRKGEKIKAKAEEALKKVLEKNFNISAEEVEIKAVEIESVTRSNSPRDQDGEVIEEVTVRSVEAVYMLFNKAREMRAISRQSGAKVDIDHCSHNIERNQKIKLSNFTSMRLCGTREQVEAAMALVARLGRNTLQVT